MKRNDVFSEAAVGLFLLAVLALLVYFTVIVSGVDVLRGRSRKYAKVVFTDVGGLKDHDSVMYRGTKVGVVEGIDLTPSNLVVRLELDGNVVLRETCKISVCSLSMLGGNYLLLEEGAGEALPVETTLFKGEPPTDWMRDISEIARNLNEFTSGGQLFSIVSNFNVVSEKVRIVAERIERGEGTVGKLVSTDDRLYNDIRGTVSGVKEVVDRVRSGEGTVGKLLSKDDSVYVDLKNTIAKASEIADRLAAGEGTVGKLLSKDSTVYDDLKASIANIKEITGKINAGEAYHK